MNKRQGAAIVAAGITLLALAACGGGGGGGYGGGSGGGGYSSSSSSSTSSSSSSSSSSNTTASAYTALNVVTDTATAAAHTDANLVNAWGVAFNPAGFVWVADNGTDKSTLYDGNGVVQSLVVNLPAGSDVTGIVFNSGTSFVLDAGTGGGPGGYGGGLSGVAAFIFAGEGGKLSAWSPTVDGTNAYTVYDGSAGGAVYKGLAIMTTGTNRLYAADVHNKRIDVFDGTFTKISVTGGFADATMPADYAPFNIQAIGNQLYVAYAKVDAGSDDEVDGAGLGYIDVFDTNGVMVKRLVSNGALNAPWGMAMAPADFGVFSGDILVGNFGDGKINAYDPTTGAMVGTLSKADGSPLVIDGLWGIAFGNGLNAQPANTLFYAAGPASEAHGAYGKITVQ